MANSIEGNLIGTGSSGSVSKKSENGLILIVDVIIDGKKRSLECHFELHDEKLAVKMFQRDSAIASVDKEFIFS